MRPSIASAVRTTCEVLCLIICVLATSAIANAQGPGAWRKDPDSAVDPVKVVKSQIGAGYDARKSRYDGRRYRRHCCWNRQHRQRPTGPTFVGDDVGG